MIAVVNPAYLKTLSDQQERSMLGQRTVFLQFHRFIFSLTDQQIYKIFDKYKEQFKKSSEEFPSDNFCDLALIKDAVQFQIAVRDDKQASPQVAEEIAMSWHANANLAKSFEEITSDHLLKILKVWLND